MAVFGDRSDFAIEADVELHRHNEDTVCGHMCIWCGGFPLGDIEEHYYGMGHAYDELNWLAQNYTTLWGEDLASLNDLRQFNFLDAILYGDCNGVELPETPALVNLRSDRRWRRFDFLTNWGEPFDGYKSFLVCPPGEPLKVLSRSFPVSAGFGVSVFRQGFEAAIQGFSAWFESQSKRLGIPCKRDASPE